MGLINQANYYMNVLITATLVIVVVIAALAYYLLKVKKIAAKEEHVNYSGFNRVDATEYVKFDDIISGSNERDSLGMIALGNNRFVAGINVSGFNFASASAEERERTMINSIAFFNVVEAPIQLRQTVKAIDISYSIQKQSDITKDLNKELIDLDEDYRATVDLLETKLDDTVAFDSISKRLDDMKRKISSKKWQYQEAQEVLEYMNKISSGAGNTKKINQIMFSYVYNPDDYTQELTPAEIYLRAKQELNNKAMIYGDAMSNCGCQWKPLTANDLTDLCRRHNHPITADGIRMDELLNSSYTALYISSDSLVELERERVGDAIYEQQLAMQEQETEERLSNARINRQAEVQVLANEATDASRDMIQEGN
jgi:hypothetical protein